MPKTTLRLDNKLDMALKMRLLQETQKARKKDPNAAVVSGQKFITDLLKKELKIK